MRPSLQSNVLISQSELQQRAVNMGLRWFRFTALTALIQSCKEATSAHLACANLCWKVDTLHKTERKVSVSDLLIEHSVNFIRIAFCRSEANI